MLHWILDDDGEPQAVEDVLTWALWFETHDRRVLRDAVRRGVAISTVFLALDHAWMGGPPVLWESMIFGGVFDGWQERYTSRLDALRGHARLIAMVETYFNVPRRLKKAWKKTQGDRTLRSGERYRLSRVLRQLDAS